MLRPPRMPRRILVAEDQTDIRDLLVMNLQQAGYDVMAVGDGQAALDSQAGDASDLLVLDLMMPRVDGLEVCKALRSQGRETPILMLTAKSTEVDRLLTAAARPEWPHASAVDPAGDELLRVS